MKPPNEDDVVLSPRRAALLATAILFGIATVVGLIVLGFWLLDGWMAVILAVAVIWFGIYVSLREEGGSGGYW